MSKDSIRKRIDELESGEADMMDIPTAGYIEDGTLVDKNGNEIETALIVYNSHE